MPKTPLHPHPYWSNPVFIKGKLRFTNLPAAAISNRELLRTIMTASGFLAFESEWWHFDDAGWTNYPVLDVPLETLP